MFCLSPCHECYGSNTKCRLGSTSKKNAYPRNCQNTQDFHAEQTAVHNVHIALCRYTVLWGKKMKNEELGKKSKKGKEKGRKITLKNGEKALKMHLFGL